MRDSEVRSPVPNSLLRNHCAALRLLRSQQAPSKLAQASALHVTSGVGPAALIAASSPTEPAVLCLPFLCLPSKRAAAILPKTSRSGPFRARHLTLGCKDSYSSCCPGAGRERFGSSRDVKYWSSGLYCQAPTSRTLRNLSVDLFVRSARASPSRRSLFYSRSSRAFTRIGVISSASLALSSLLPLSSKAAFGSKEAPELLNSSLEAVYGSERWCSKSQRGRFSCRGIAFILLCPGLGFGRLLSLSA